LLVSKRDLVDEPSFTALSERLTRINRRAPIRVVDHGKIDLAELLDVRGFNLNADLGGGMSLRPVSLPRLSTAFPAWCCAPTSRWISTSSANS
jgi:G3E family GTPase